MVPENFSGEKFSTLVEAAALVLLALHLLFENGVV
jgi:hypothetical protein